MKLSWLSSRRPALLLLLGIILLGGHPRFSLADTTNLPPGYSINLVSADLAPNDVSNIPQLAFKPGDLTHVYATRNAADKVSRYDYDPVTGELSNETTVAAYTDSPRAVIGLGFHGTNLYTSASLSDGDRISRWFDANNDGVYEGRHDIVHSIPTGDHNADQIQIQGDSLYVGIGGADRNGNDAVENIYTLAVARIVDLTQALTTTVGSDFKGPLNYLASPGEWINTAGSDGQLRYFASGFRNPFGIAFDPEGDLWVSVNGNNDAGYVSSDFLYKKVQPGDEGEFPPAAFGFDKYIYGNPITNLVDFGVSPSPGGFDFILEGPDAGTVVLGNLGATRTNAIGRNLVLINPTNGSYREIYQWTGAPNGSRFQYSISDVVRDPFGRFLIADYGHARIWRLTPPLPPPTLSVVATGNQVDLSWPLTAIDHQLQTSTDPATPGSWTLSPISPQLTPNGLQASAHATNASRFFRLIKN